MFVLSWNHPRTVSAPRRDNLRLLVAFPFLLYNNNYIHTYEPQFCHLFRVIIACRHLSSNGGQIHLRHSDLSLVSMQWLSDTALWLAS